MAKRAKMAVAQLKLRVPESLRTKLEESATRHGTSLNAEIVRRLGSSVLPQTDHVAIRAEMHEAIQDAIEKLQSFLVKYPTYMTREEFEALSAKYGGPSPSIRKKESKK